MYPIAGALRMLLAAGYNDQVVPADLKEAGGGGVVAKQLRNLLYVLTLRKCKFVFCIFVF